MNRLALLPAAAFAASLFAAGPAPDCKLVPGWEQQGPARTFVADNLFEYMNGNAEGYIMYQFVKMSGLTCRSGGDTFVIDISEMADPESAWGMFTANKDPKKPVEKIGLEGQIVPRRAVFVKDRYYVEIAADPAKDHSPALRAFTAQLEKLITGAAAPPAILGWFPTDKLRPGGIRLVPESVLGLRMLKRGFVAEYESGKAFIVSESTPEAASGLLKKLQGRIGAGEPAKVADEAFQTADKYLGRMCIFRKGRYLAGFANLKENEDAVALAAALAARMP